MFELRLASGTVVRWQGRTGEDAAVRYADAHPGVTVVAWRAGRPADVMALTRGCLIDGQPVR